MALEMNFVTVVGYIPRNDVQDAEPSSASELIMRVHPTELGFPMVERRL